LTTFDAGVRQARTYSLYIATATDTAHSTIGTRALNGTGDRLEGDEPVLDVLER